jgi:two-component system nitrate/nitrite response regulator NarL
MKPLRVMLVDDQVLFREGMVSLLETTPEKIQVVGEAENGLEATEKAKQLRPDLILMDIGMPRCDGLEATRQIKNQVPDVKIVMLTVSDHDSDLFEAIKAGAQGYLLKNLSAAQLFEMLDGVSRGEAPISRVTATRILEEFAQASRENVGAGSSPSAQLTRREKEVLGLVVEGASNKDIADALIISESTVKNHLRNILEKLHVQNRVQAAVVAVREGLVWDS